MNSVKRLFRRKLMKVQDDGITQSSTESHIKGHSLWKDAFLQFRRNKMAMVALSLLCLMALCVWLGPYCSPFSFRATDWSAIFQPPSFASGHIFGTDSLGRDIFVRTMSGGRMSLLIGLVSSIVSIMIGVAYGATAGLWGGKTDGVMMRIVDILYSLPFLFFVIVLMTFFGRHIILIFVAIGAINWLDMARIVRGQTLSLRHKEFIEAAYAYGVNQFSVILRHIVPNLLGVVMIYATLTIPQVIITESLLSFLGLGVQEPHTSWGVLVNDGVHSMSVAWWTLFFPTLMLVITLLCFNFIGDGLRDALDPKSR